MFKKLYRDKYLNILYNYKILVFILKFFKNKLYIYTFIRIFIIKYIYINVYIRY